MNFFCNKKNDLDLFGIYVMDFEFFGNRAKIKRKLEKGNYSASNAHQSIILEN